MTSLRTVASRLLAFGVLSRGWDAILTGLALLYVARLLASVPPADDPAAWVVAASAALTGLWQLEHGVRAELARWRSPGAGHA